MCRLLLINLILILSFSSCNNERPEAVIPFATVNQEINLDLIQYQDLRRPGGYVYIAPGNFSGYKGIIIYHDGDGVYRAFERACSFDPRADCDPVVVDDSGIFLEHTCCKSTFDFNGNPTGGQHPCPCCSILLM